MPNYLNDKNEKSVYLYVCGGDYAAIEFVRNYNPQEVYEEMCSSGETLRVIDEDDYIELRIVEFKQVDSTFVDWIKDNLCDYDQLKARDIIEVQPVQST
ncbi:hypothetical protein [Paenibacillus sp. M2]|uniref:hypothetical protein n=1 Tax=Paenibacillus sp. M2 TaxID=3341793 RepID=UPI003989CF53